MKIRNLLIIPSLLTTFSSISLAISCNKPKKEECTITFKECEGISITSQKITTVKPGTKWKDVVKPQISAQTNIEFDGWTINGLFIKDDDIISNDLTITAKAFDKTWQNDFLVEYHEDGTCTVFYYRSEQIKENVVIPPYCFDENGKKFKVNVVGGNFLISDHGNDIKTLTLPYTLESFDGAQITNKTKIETIKVDVNNRIYSSQDENGNETGCVFTKNTNELITCYDLNKIPNFIKKIPRKMFYQFPRFNSQSVIKIPEQIEEIGESAFEGCAFNSVTFPKGLKKIGDNAFAICPCLNNINFECDECEFGVGVFTLNINLETISLPKNNTQLGTSTFAMCEKLKTVKLPEKLKEINSYSFIYCPNLKTIQLPESLEHILPNAFSESGIETIYIPKNVNQISSGSFYGANNLKEIEIDSNNQTYESINKKCIVDKVNNVLVKNIDSTIPDGIETIGEFSMACSTSETINVPDSVKNIKSSAFSDSLSLKNINLGKNVSVIDSYAFYNTPARASITVNSENETFKSNDGTEEINCVMDNSKVILGGASTALDKLPEQITDIGTLAFSYLKAFNNGELVIPSSIKNIESDAFIYNEGINTLTIPNDANVEGTWSQEIFTGCKNLRTINFNMHLDNWPSKWADNIAYYVPLDGTITFPDQQTCNLVTSHWQFLSGWTKKIGK